MAIFDSSIVASDSSDNSGDDDPISDTSGPTVTASATVTAAGAEAEEQSVREE